MKIQKKLLLISSITLTAIFIFTAGFITGQNVYSSSAFIKKISIEEYHKLVEEKLDFILYIGRASCKFCSITSSSLDKFADCSLPVYNLELEPYFKTDQYDEIKEELGIVYVPSFKYIEDGEIKYHMNSPLDSHYYVDGSDRAALRKEMEEKILDFINGASGSGPVINEVVDTGQIVAEPIEIGKG